MLIHINVTSRNANQKESLVFSQKFIVTEFRRTLVYTTNNWTNLNSGGSKSESTRTPFGDRVETK